MQERCNPHPPPCLKLVLFIQTFITNTHTAPYRIQQRCPHILPIAIPQARATELAPHTATALVPTDRLGVDGLLPALMARVTLWIKQKKWM